jgi:hypothetical protein
MELRQLQMVNVTPKTDKKVVQVQRSSMISEYNRYMGGTDLLDQNVSKYRICVTRKKWWWAIFTWLIEVAVVKTWLIARKVKPKLEFGRDVSSEKQDSTKICWTAFNVQIKCLSEQGFG